MINNPIYKKALNYGLRLLLIQSRTISQLKKKLNTKGYSDDVCNAVIEQLNTWKYLDDKKYAENYIAAKKINGIGRKKLYYNLLKKGVSSEITAEALDNYFEEELEKAQLNKIAIKKTLILHKDCPSEQLKKKLFRFLVGRGFSVQEVISWINTELTSVLDNITNKL